MKFIPVLILGFLTLHTLTTTAHIIRKRTTGLSIHPEKQKEIHPDKEVEVFDIFVNNNINEELNAEDPERNDDDGETISQYKETKDLVVTKYSSDNGNNILNKNEKETDNDEVKSEEDIIKKPNNQQQVQTVPVKIAEKSIQTDNVDEKIRHNIAYIAEPLAEVIKEVLYTVKDNIHNEKINGKINDDVKDTGHIKESKENLGESAVQDKVKLEETVKDFAEENYEKANESTYLEDEKLKESHNGHIQTSEKNKNSGSEQDEDLSEDKTQNEKKNHYFIKEYSRGYGEEWSKKGSDKGVTFYDGIDKDGHFKKDFNDDSYKGFYKKGYLGGDNSYSGYNDGNYGYISDYKKYKDDGDHFNHSKINGDEEKDGRNTKYSDEYGLNRRKNYSYGNIEDKFDYRK